jgi:hypothetical protein
VLVLFIFLEQRSCQFFRGIDHRESRLLLALDCPFCVGQGSLLSAHVEF